MKTRRKKSLKKSEDCFPENQMVIREKIAEIPGTLHTLRNPTMIRYSRLGGMIYYNRREVKNGLEKPEKKESASVWKNRINRFSLV